ncbi:MAG: hypothetical protein Q9175_007154 [Cornicularia normoerica]
MKFPAIAAATSAACLAKREGFDQAECACSVLPTSTVNPLSVSSAPTNVPGENGLSGCAAVDAGDGQGCPGVDYCNCNEVYVDFLYATVSGSASRNCKYSVQPTANDCPKNTAALSSVSAATSAAAVGSRVTPCCNVVGTGCACSDGGTPEQDEDGRCCINVDSHGNTVCSASTTGCPIPALSSSSGTGCTSPCCTQASDCTGTCAKGWVCSPAGIGQSTG